jgi:hypothetical protein
MKNNIYHPVRQKKCYGEKQNVHSLNFIYKTDLPLKEKLKVNIPILFAGDSLFQNP